MADVKEIVVTFSRKVSTGAYENADILVSERLALPDGTALGDKRVIAALASVYRELEEFVNVRADSIRR